MSDKCGNCDCADKTQCVKKGDSYGAVVADSHALPAAEDFAGENDGCKCGSNCSCGSSCKCGGH
nr:unnamed protein product [Digitaria exilis]